MGVGGKEVSGVGGALLRQSGVGSTDETVEFVVLDCAASSW